METVSKFKGITGMELLNLVGKDDPIVNLNGEMTSVIPMTMPFSNRGEIATIDEATHVAVQTRFMDTAMLVEI